MDELNENIKELSALIKRQNSFKRNFFLSLVQGIGSAIGATIVAGAIIALVYRILLTIEPVSLLNKIIPPDYIEKIIEKKQQ